MSVQLYSDTSDSDNDKGMSSENEDEDESRLRIMLPAPAGAQPAAAAANTNQSKQKGKSRKVATLDSVSGGKQQIPWRKDGKVLLEELFGKVIEKKLHLNTKGNKDDRWASFVNNDLIGDGTSKHPGQPSWRNLEGSARTIEEHFQKKIKEVCHQMGWTESNGGRTGNLSGKEGHKLTLIEEHVKSIVQDIEKAKEDKKAAKDLKDKCDKTELTVLVNGLSTESRGKKRSHSETGSSKSGGSRNVSGISSADAAFFRMFGIGGDIGAEVCKDESLLLAWFKGTNNDYYELVRDSKCDVGCRLDRAGVEELLDAITFEIIANTYSRNGKGPDLALFKSDMAAYDVPVLCAHKLFVFLKTKVEEIVKGQKETNAAGNGGNDDDDDEENGGADGAEDDRA